MAQYSILLIPENHLESKRFHLPKIAVHLGLVFFVLALCFTTAMTWGFIHYRQVAQHLRTEMKPGDEQTKIQMISKIQSLEQAFQRTQQYAARIESLMQMDSGKMKMGVGPLSEEEDFGKYLEEISKLPKPKGLTYNSSFDTSSNLYQQLGSKLEDVSNYALSVETQLNEVYELSQDKFSYWASTPSITPVRGWLTSDFGSRSSPFNGAPKFHEGVDIAASVGSPVFAPSDGIVSFSGNKGGYGNALILDHGYGITTLYGHNSTLEVKEGQKVKRGQLIARVGMSGSTTGPHLHYEVHVDGVPTDPMKFILR